MIMTGGCFRAVQGYLALYAMVVIIREERAIDEMSNVFTPK